MPFADSVDKVVTSYFVAVTKKPLRYKGRVYMPKALTISPMVFRGFTCPPGCGGCCPRFSLDYLPFEERPASITQQRLVEINGQARVVYSDLQSDHTNHHCKNLRMSDGRCGIHGKQPFSCDFELMRFMHTADKDVPNTLTQRLFGRGWQFLRVDDKRGAMCEMTPADSETVAEVVRKLGRLKTWMEYFNVSHRLDQVIAWAKAGPHSEPLTV